MEIILCFLVQRDVFFLCETAFAMVKATELATAAVTTLCRVSHHAAGDQPVL